MSVNPDDLISAGVEINVSTTEVTVDATTGNADIGVAVSPAPEVTVDATLSAIDVSISTAPTIDLSVAAVNDIDVNVTTAPDITIDTGYVGPQGPPGPQGPQGPPGSSGAGATYTHTQIAASDTWTIVHNLGFNPAVTVVDSAGSVIIGALQYTDVTTAVIRFTGATSGKAYCS